MKSRKLLALFLAIFMLVSLIVPASAETITPETNVTNGIIGYDAALVDKLTTEEMAAIPSISTFDVDDIKSAYKISNKTDWAAFDVAIATIGAAGQRRAFIGTTIYLADNIDFGSTTENEVVISPIGDKGPSDWGFYSFAGIFDGQGYSVKNVTVRPESQFQILNGVFGLFSSISADPTQSAPCEIKNLIVDSSVKFDTSKLVDGTAMPATFNTGAKDEEGNYIYKDTYSFYAALVGTVDGLTSSKDATKEGIVNIQNVWNKADVNYTSTRNAGGMIAFVKRATLNVTNCTNSGKVATTTTVDTYGTFVADRGVGGIVGAVGEFVKGKNNYLTAVNMKNCRFDGTMSSTFKGSVGGMVGSAFGSNTDGAQTTVSVCTITIDNCINNGTISTTGSGWCSYGSMMGYYKGGATVSITNCKNYGTVSAAGGAHGISTQVNHASNTSNPGGMDPTYNMVAKYYQMSNATYKNTEDADCYSLRLVALHNGKLDVLDSYSYEVTIKYTVDVEGTPTTKTVKASTGELTSVRTEIAVDDKLGTGVTKISASTLGADYVSAVCINNIPTSIGAIEVTIVPTMTKGETTTTAAPITFTVDPAVYNAQ